MKVLSDEKRQKIFLTDEMTQKILQHGDSTGYLKATIVLADDEMS